MKGSALTARRHYHRPAFPIQGLVWNPDRERIRAVRALPRDLRQERIGRAADRGTPRIEPVDQGVRDSSRKKETIRSLVPRG